MSPRLPSGFVGWAIAMGGHGAQLSVLFAVQPTTRKQAVTATIWYLWTPWLQAPHWHTVCRMEAEQLYGFSQPVACHAYAILNGAADGFYAPATMAVLSELRLLLLAGFWHAMLLASRSQL